MVNYAIIQNAVLSDLRSNLNDDNLNYAIAHAILVALKEYDREKDAEKKSFRHP